MTTRTLKPSTVIKKRIQGYIGQYGLEHTTDVTLEEGVRLLIVPPNRFGPGYVKLVLPAEGCRWEAEFSRRTTGKLMEPKRHFVPELFFKDDPAGLEDYQNRVKWLRKADADADVYFYQGKKEWAFKVLQERVYPLCEWFKQRDIPLPFKLFSTVAYQ